MEDELNVVKGHVLTREFGNLNGVCVTLQAKASQTLPAILVGQVEVPHQILCGRFLHVQLVSILLVEEAHFLQQDETLQSGLLLILILHQTVRNTVRN